MQMHLVVIVDYIVGGNFTISGTYSMILNLLTISTLGNSQDFGDLNDGYSSWSCIINAEQEVIGAGRVNTINFVELSINGGFS